MKKAIGELIFYIVITILITWLLIWSLIQRRNHESYRARSNVQKPTSRQ